jgi:pyruvate formate-lyase activating enzyme-like uncharacterized protein
MIKTHWTLEEIIKALDRVDMGAGAQPSVDIVEMIMYVERLFYTSHVSDIRKRQAKLKKLWVDKTKFLAVWNGAVTEGAISPGCYACLKSNISHVRHSSSCTQDCDFCYYASNFSTHNCPTTGKGLYTFSGGTMMQYTLDETLTLLDRQLVNQVNPYPVTAVGWLQKEPLMELDAIEPVMTYIRDNKFHQYMYTNGVKATKKAIDKLADWGLNEIRFNLQATDFDDKVIKRMAYAKKKIPWVLIETPMFSLSYDNFVNKKDMILDTGVDQINLPELQICSMEKLPKYIQQEGPVYKHRRGYISPISSRHYTYDLIAQAETEDWDVIINDCSNDTKFYRGASPHMQLGIVNYQSAFELPFRCVAYLANMVLEPGVEYEFFQS